MRRKVLMPMLLGMVLVLVAGVLAGAGTLAIFTDTETSHGNVATAGVLDLKVKGSSWDDDPNIVHMTIDNMKPGETRSFAFKLKNAGTVPGNVTLKIKNPMSYENTLEEPEIAAGDQDGVEIDPTGYDANGGDGELWDQITMKICVDKNGNKKCDWNEPIIFNDFGTPSVDYSSYYSLPLDTNLFPMKVGYYNPDKWVILNPGEKVTIVFEIHFVDDQSNWWWGAQGSLSNNMAMSDSVEFDIEFGLVQA
ncbi:TasA family protein [Palaeococcus sp. (in: euryarchaeotes)]